MRTHSSKHPLQFHDLTGLPFNQVSQSNIPGHFFAKWRREIFVHLSPESPANPMPGNESNALLAVFEADINAFCEALMEYFASPAPRDEKKSYLRTNVKLMVRFIDKLEQLPKAEGYTPELTTCFGILTDRLVECLEFMEELFSEDFDRDEKVPSVLLRKRKKELQLLFQQVLFSFSEKDGPTSSICRIVFKNVEQFFADETSTIRFKDLSYHKELLEDLALAALSPSASALQEILYYHNYNHEDFVEAECERLREAFNQGTNNKQRIALLKLEQKNINQFPVKLDWGYSESMPPLKQQVNNWINEEVKYLESGYAQHGPEVKEDGYTEKIQTSLSVAKLAVIIRLLVLDKIIINRSVAPMLKVVAGVFTTLQRENISFGSLESKYHAPDKATVNIVRQMLFKWINILGKL